MYFTDNKELQRFERDMKLVPNFERKEIWEYGDSCRDCKNYESKIVSCMEAHCPYLKRKIRSNAVSTRDLVETFLADNAYIPFSHRAIDMLAKYRGNKLFISKWHKAAFEKATAEVPDDDYNRLACLYVLTIRPQISEYIVHTSNGYVCLSSNLIPKDMVLINFANDLYLGKKQISLKEISYRKYVSDKEFFSKLCFQQAEVNLKVWFCIAFSCTKTSTSFFEVLALRFYLQCHPYQEIRHSSN